MKFAATLVAVSSALPLISAAAISPLWRRQNAATSLTLDPSVICSNFANDGQQPPVAGQVASLTSTNNFINFCVGKTLTNGLQVTGGSCNPTPIGDIPSTGNMPSAKFVFPKNGASIAADKAFTIQMSIKNLVTGNFVNAQKSYFAGPQQLQGGQILGHSHVVVEALTSLDQTTVTDPNKFAFFKGLNNVAANGVLSADVTAGLPAGAYRMCSINSSSNHQPAIVAIAQHGSLDDCSYFSVTAGGAAAGGNGAGGNGAAVTAAPVVTAAPAATQVTKTSEAATPTAVTPPAVGGNLQKFTGALGGVVPPTVLKSGAGFQVTGNSLINQLGSALARSCDVQNNKCADAANKGGNQNGVTVNACNTQQSACLALAFAA